jgi:hypothetical protein
LASAATSGAGRPSSAKVVSGGAGACRAASSARSRADGWERRGLDEGRLEPRPEGRPDERLDVERPAERP